MRKLPSDSEMMKLYHLGYSDREIAERYDVTVQAVNKVFARLSLPRKPVVRRVNAGLQRRWGWIKVADPYEASHHSNWPGKMLKLHLRQALGDEGVSQDDQDRVQAWLRETVAEDYRVLCYEPDSEAGWYYRPRRPEDGWLIVDWPSQLPYPDEEFEQALQIPEEYRTKNLRRPDLRDRAQH